MSKKIGIDVLRKDVNEQMLQNEYQCSSLKGVKGLSRSDLDSILFYANIWEKQKGYLGQSYMEPRGKIKEVLDRYGIKFNKI